MRRAVAVTSSGDSIINSSDPHEADCHDVDTLQTVVERLFTLLSLPNKIFEDFVPKNITHEKFEGKEKAVLTTSWDLPCSACKVILVLRKGD